MDRPTLSVDQQTTIHRAASDLLVAAASGLPFRMRDHDLHGCADIRVYGAGLSLWRAGCLRCSGVATGAEDSLPISQALEQAARTAPQDRRFPSISPLELEHLQMRVHLLYDPQPLPGSLRAKSSPILDTCQGADVRAGTAQGVAVWDEIIDGSGEDLMVLACERANLAATAWHHPEVSVTTFKTMGINRPLESELIKRGTFVPAKPFSPETLENLAASCAQNVFAFLRDATPSYVLPNCPEGTVSGVGILVADPKREGMVEVSRIELRSGVALQSTLFGLSQAAANAFQQHHGDSIPESLNLAVALVYDPMLHGSLEAQDFKGCDTKMRGIFVSNQDGYALEFDPAQEVAQLFDRARNEFPSTTASATVYSVAVATTDSPLSISIFRE